MILKIKVIMKIIIIIVIKYRGRNKTLTAINTELLMTLYNGQRPLTNIKNNSTSHAVGVLYTPLKWLIHHLT